MRSYARYVWSVVLLSGMSVGQAVATEPGVAKEDVTFENAGVTLAGTLYRPEHPVAAVVLVHGSGQEKRMAGFASRLADQGIAALTYDKRGVGESGGRYVGPEVGSNNVDAGNLGLLAADANAAVGALQKHLPGTHGPVGLLGYSQAGWVIPIAAERNPAVTFMVLFSGPVATAREQLRFQFYTESKPTFWDSHTEADARKHIAEDKDRYQFADTDPREALGKLSIRGLWVYGGKDVQAPVQLSIERLDALDASGKRYEHRLYPTLAHNTAFAKSDEGKEAVQAAVQWIRSVANEPSPTKH
ncbi:MAG: hypothetical protein GAK28_03803 [Luteibacter sp.]|nr:MAG: hypothetical protein GAK28_03803 [Luteibacter sp.]